jgi:IS5 family transposase
VAEFDWLFLSELNEDNRWVKLADANPREALNGPYLESFANSTLGRPAKPARLVTGAVIIKHRSLLPPHC